MINKQLNYISHIEHLLIHDEFLEELKIIRDQLEQKYGKGVSFQTHPLALKVYAETGKLYIASNQDHQLIIDLAKSWSIKLEDLVLIADGHVNKYKFDNLFAMKGIKVTERNRKLILEIGPNTTRQDLIDNWKAIEYGQELVYGSRRTKKKSNENPKLIFAIYLQRRKNKSFRDIYNLYETNKLKPYVNASKSKQFCDQESLARYYRKYKQEATIP